MNEIQRQQLEQLNGECSVEPEWEEEDIEDMRVKELGPELKRHKLKVGGLKAEKQQRLREHYMRAHKNEV